jgi:hypothetical protein
MSLHHNMQYAGKVFWSFFTVALRHAFRDQKRIEIGAFMHHLLLGRGEYPGQTRPAARFEKPSAEPVGRPNQSGAPGVRALPRGGSERKIHGLLIS